MALLPHVPGSKSGLALVFVALVRAWSLGAPSDRTLDAVAYLMLGITSPLAYHWLDAVLWQSALEMMVLS